MDLAEVTGKVDFGIITIREDEFRAVLQRFPPADHVEGQRRYAIHRVSLSNSHSYVIAMVRCPEQGEGEGQDVARDMIIDLDPQWIMLVGIAGAVPDYEFTLGDVIVATRLHDFSIEASLEDREPEYGVRGGPMQKAVQDLLASLPALDNKLQGWNAEESIGMRKPPVKLRPDNFYGDEAWRKEVKEKLAKHFGRKAASRPPYVTTGAIVSSDRLVKNSKIIKAWRQAARQLRAVEMELAGVYQAARRKEREYPILAIRGISDIVGFKRDPDWTIYACNSAAAFARAIILTECIKPISATSREGSASEVERIRNEILEYLESLKIPTIHDTLLSVTETLEVLLKAKENEELRKEGTRTNRVGRISDPRYYARLGAFELEYKNYSEAADLLSHSIELDGQQGAVHFNLFKALLSLGRFDEALEAYERAINIDGNLRILPDKYHIIGILGRGAFSTVYKAKLKPVGKILAVKVLHGEHMRNYQVATSFRNEAILNRRLNHESFAFMYEQNLFKGRYYVALEYVEAASLRQLIQSRELTPKEVLGITEQLLTVVAFMHKRGVIHRDIKPDNILITAPGLSVKLIDFGVAVQSSSTKSTFFPAAGTPAYMPPELFESLVPSSSGIFAGKISRISTATDIYSLGVTIFEAMTGERPRVNVELPRPDGYPSSIWTVVISMLSPNPHDRPSADEALSTLQQKHEQHET